MSKYTKPFYVQMTSNKEMEHCDGYPHLSIQWVKQEKETGTLWLNDRIDSLHDTFKTKRIDMKGRQTKTCYKCDNKFLLDAPFIQGMCQRCASRCKPYK